MRVFTSKSFSFALSFVWMFLFGAALNAQNGQYDVQFSVKNLDCSTGKVVIQLQVKSHDASHTFLMGDANYRFDYDPRVIKNPTIVSQENFSNQAPASDGNYSPQNLNGSSVGTTIGTVSLNTFYGQGGTGAKLVPTTWTTVSCISFTIQDPTKCINLVWHKDTDFPQTGMNEVELLGGGNYNLDIVAAGGIFGNYNLCIPTVCSAVIAVDDINSTLKNTPVSGSVATNDVSSGGPMSFTLLTTTPNTAGLLVFNPDGTYTFTPITGFVGKTQATYKVCNTSGQCDTANLYITVIDNPVAGVNAAPVAQNDNAQTLVNTAVSGNVLSNDIDPNGDALTASTLKQPTNGTLTLNPNGTYTYTPNPGFIGQDTFRYKVCDNGTPSLCDSAIAVMTMNVPPPTTVNVKPNAQDDAGSGLAMVPISGNLSSNDSDPNPGQTLHSLQSAQALQLASP